MIHGALECLDDDLPLISWEFPFPWGVSPQHIFVAVDPIRNL
jgi:hypothetical protein